MEVQVCNRIRGAIDLNLCSVQLSLARASLSRCQTQCRQTRFVYVAARSSNLRRHDARVQVCGESLMSPRSNCAFLDDDRRCRCRRHDAASRAPSSLAVSSRDSDSRHASACVRTAGAVRSCHLFVRSSVLSQAYKLSHRTAVTSCSSICLTQHGRMTGCRTCRS